MKSNIGKADKIIRILLAVLFGILYFSNTVVGIAGMVLLILGVVFVLTSFIGVCPLYSIFHLNTKNKKQ